MAQPDWFPFEPEDDFTGPSVIGMADWLERPAGKRGFVQVRGDRLVFEDCTPVKFWGTNICNARVASPKERADRFANRLAKYGVNIVRMHKFTWPGEREGIGDPLDSLKLIEDYSPALGLFLRRAPRSRDLHRMVSHLWPPPLARGPRASRRL